MSWRDNDEEFRPEGVKGGLRSKPRFSFTEVRLLLEAVKRNRYIILKKFNQGVSAETKKQTWVEITNQINGLGENHREVRQIMKKWADLKCDGKRRMVALRGPNGSNVRKKNLGPVERMVHKILMMSPRGDGESDLDLGEDEDLSKLYPASTYSYLSLTDSSHSFPGGGGGGGGGASLDLSPLSSPEKELAGDPFHSSSDFDLADDGERTMDFDENDDSLFCSYPASLAPPPPSTSLDPLPDDALLRVKPVHTYSRSGGGGGVQNHVGNAAASSRPPLPPSSSVASTSSVFPSVSDTDSASSSTTAAAPPSPTGSNMAALPAPFSLPPPPTSSTSVNDSSSIPPAPATSSSRPPPPSNPRDPLPAGASSRRAREQVAQLASQSVQQQRSSRLLLSSVSRSLEVLAQSLQLLVESQQEFVQESLLLQRQTVDVLRDFSNTALAMLRDKSGGGQHPSSASSHF